MTQNQILAATLQTSLKLDRPPVGVAFVESCPPGVAALDAPAPSACTFWQRAENRVLYASAEDHGGCPIGAMTMGFELSESGQQAAMELVGTMVSLDYFAMEEVDHLPSVRKPHSGVVYGPLGQLPVPPDLVLVVVSPFQAMLLTESGGDTTLREAPMFGVMGRPACSALPRALNDGETTMSLGCIGARTYAEIPEDRALVVIPAARLAATVARLGALVQANATLAEYHAQKKLVAGRLA